MSTLVNGTVACDRWIERSGFVVSSANSVDALCVEIQQSQDTSWKHMFNTSWTTRRKQQQHPVSTWYPDARKEEVAKRCIQSQDNVPVASYSALHPVDKDISRRDEFSRSDKSAAKQLTIYESWMSTAERNSNGKNDKKPAKEKDAKAKKMKRRRVDGSADGLAFMTSSVTSSQSADGLSEQSQESADSADALCVEIQQSQDTSWKHMFNTSWTTRRKQQQHLVSTWYQDARKEEVAKRCIQSQDNVPVASYSALHPVDKDISRR
ncbi:far upstream element-binding protein 1-like [Dorcoceras hygrometricum]|uniref:Far upstream element-binding protein 1-like n=1 Tax=Dorcoceras hygrometricum TaxID=472368 RepID=A0A2Z7BEL3_9LAMI|nr:far upstream element-binding protein 1-like [Dorcoceras hygrometricum]